MAKPQTLVGVPLPANVCLITKITHRFRDMQEVAVVHDHVKCVRYLLIEWYAPMQNWVLWSRANGSRCLSRPSYDAPIKCEITSFSFEVKEHTTSTSNNRCGCRWCSEGLHFDWSPIIIIHLHNVHVSDARWVNGHSSRINLMHFRVRINFFYLLVSWRVETWIPRSERFSPIRGVVKFRIYRFAYT